MKSVVVDKKFNIAVNFGKQLLGLDCLHWVESDTSLNSEASFEIEMELHIEFG